MAQVDTFMDDFVRDISGMNSAKAVSQAYKEHENNVFKAQKAAQEKANRDAAVIAGTEAIIKQNDLLKEELASLAEQNSKLSAMYEMQVEANLKAEIELKDSKKYNKRMLIIAIIAMLATIASLIISLIGKCLTFLNM